MGRNDCENCGRDAGPDGLFHNEGTGTAVCDSCDIKLTEAEELALNGPDSPNPPSAGDVKEAWHRDEIADAVPVDGLDHNAYATLVVERLTEDNPEAVRLYVKADETIRMMIETAYEMGRREALNEMGDAVRAAEARGYVNAKSQAVQ